MYSTLPPSSCQPNQKFSNLPIWLLRQYNPDLDLDRIQPGVVIKFPRLRAIAAESAVASRPQVLADNGR